MLITISIFEIFYLVTWRKYFYAKETLLIFRNKSIVWMCREFYGKLNIYTEIRK